jgi:NAD(P)H-dependent flavin oxidoreductase YrpB (nitropropane dioxygenase family)
MKLPELRIGSMTTAIPIVQGGMGVRVSRASLAAAVANQGGIGTLSAIGLGDMEASKNRYVEESNEALASEIREAKSMTDGHLAVNVMGVLSNADEIVKTAAHEGIKMIVYGAGLPTKLPALVKDTSVNLVPIISSARVGDLIMRTWDRRHDRTVDAFILEGPLAGAHLGFSQEQLADPAEFSLEKLLPPVLESVKPYEQKYQKKIPVIVAGGIYTGADIARMLSLDADRIETQCKSGKLRRYGPGLKEREVFAMKGDVGIWNTGTCRSLRHGSLYA